MAQLKASAAHGVAGQSSKAKKYGLDYDSCSRKELLSFLRRRRVGYDESAPITRRAIIKVLEHADTEANFRFTDLASEMRNRIYEELLVIHPHSRCCFPQILATSSQMQREALGILYDVEDAEIGVGKRCGTNGHHVADAQGYIFTFTCGGITRKWEAEPLIELPTGPARWPPFLLRLRSLRLKLELAEADVDALPATFLLPIICFLQSSKVLRSLTIEFDVKGTYNAQTAARALYMLLPRSRLLTTMECASVQASGQLADRAEQDTRCLSEEQEKLYALNIPYKAALVAEELDFWRRPDKALWLNGLTSSRLDAVRMDWKLLHWLHHSDGDYERQLNVQLVAAVAVLDAAYQEMIDSSAGHTLGARLELVATHRRRMEAFPGLQALAATHQSGVEAFPGSSGGFAAMPMFGSRAFAGGS
ncbi:hypothetical protein LTR85_007880 [Meristemomyces frigidus]|nr:hypothetical protein LTR85_007880 [Meristemomyces frigidus]